MPAVDPVRHGRVMLAGYQQRQREAMQQAFGRAFPLTVFGPYLDQLTGERQHALVGAELGTERVPQVQGLLGDVAAAVTQADQLRVDLVRPGPALAKVHSLLDELV